MLDKPRRFVCARPVLLPRHGPHDRCDEDGPYRPVSAGAYRQLAVILLSDVHLLYVSYVSARIFRAGVLLYEQRMTLGGVLRALRVG